MFMFRDLWWYNETWLKSDLGFLFLQADFLKGLPVYNKSNFSRFHADSVCKASVSTFFSCPLKSVMLWAFAVEKTYLSEIRKNN